MRKLQPVVDLTCPAMERLYDILIIIIVAMIIVQFRRVIETFMIMRYYQFYEENCASLPLEWIIRFEESIQTGYTKIDKYTPRG